MIQFITRTMITLRNIEVKVIEGKPVPAQCVPKDVRRATKGQQAYDLDTALLYDIS